MMAEITTIVSNTITVDSGYTASTSASFENGSIVHKVDTITYDSPTGWTGITRNDGNNTFTMLPNSQMTVTYQDSSGSSLTTPLSRSEIANTLYSINVKVEVRGEKNLKDGSTYTASAEQTVLLRNLMLIRN